MAIDTPDVLRERLPGSQEETDALPPLPVGGTFSHALLKSLGPEQMRSYAGMLDTHEIGQPVSAWLRHNASRMEGALALGNPERPPEPGVAGWANQQLDRLNTTMGTVAGAALPYVGAAAAGTAGGSVAGPGGALAGGVLGPLALGVGSGQGSLFNELRALDVPVDEARRLAKTHGPWVGAVQSIPFGGAAAKAAGPIGAKGLARTLAEQYAHSAAVMGGTGAAAAGVTTEAVGEAGKDWKTALSEGLESAGEMALVGAPLGMHGPAGAPKRLAELPVPQDRRVPDLRDTGDRGAPSGTMFKRSEADPSLPGMYSEIRRVFEDGPDEAMANVWAQNFAAYMNKPPPGRGIKPLELERSGVLDFLERKKEIGEPVAKSEILDHLDSNAVKLEAIERTGDETRWHYDPQAEDEGSTVTTPAGGEPGTYTETLITAPGMTKDGQPYKEGHFPGVDNIIAHTRTDERVDREGNRYLTINEVQATIHQEAQKRRIEEIDRISREEGIEKSEASKRVPRDFGYETAEKKQAREEASAAYKAATDAWAAATDAWAAATDAWEVDPSKENDDRRRALYVAKQEAATRANELTPSSRALPDAPFKDWIPLTLKHALASAVRKGLTRLAWTTGDMQNERNSLSTKIRELRYHVAPDGKYEIEAFPLDHDDRTPVTMTVSPRDLAGAVGKDIAGRIQAEEGEVVTGARSSDPMVDIDIRTHHGLDKIAWRNLPEPEKNDLRKAYYEIKPDALGTTKRALKGEGLEMGGDGKRAIYDVMVKNELERLGKRWGVKAKSVELPHERPGGRAGPDEADDTPGEGPRYEVKISGPDFVIRDYDKGGKIVEKFGTRDEAEAAIRQKYTAHETYHYIDIPPEMAASIREDGLPLYKRTGEEAEPGTGKKLMHDLEGIYERSPEYVEKRQQVEAAAKDVLKKLAPELDLTVADRLIAEIDGKREEVAGAYYTPALEGNLLDHMVAISMRSPDWEASLNHEIVHFLRRAGYINDAEWSVLQRRAEGKGLNERENARMADLRSREELNASETKELTGLENKANWIQRFDIEKLYPNRQDIWAEEAVAKAKEAFLRGELKPGTFIAKVFDKIAQFFDALGLRLEEFGFTSPEQVFRRVDSGEVGGRNPGRDEAGTVLARDRIIQPDAEPSIPEDQDRNPLALKEGWQDRLNRTLSRGNDVGQPENRKGRPAKELVDPTTGYVYYIGEPTPEQWIRRVESVLSPEEIRKAANWYAEAPPVYQEIFGRKLGIYYMAAWLMANKNATPEFAMTSALRTREQTKTGKQGDKKGGLAHDALMDFWSNITDDMEREGSNAEPPKIKGEGIGQKLYDFMDSTLGKSTRTWMGNDARGGEPFVADIHSLRDRGFMDETTLDRLKEVFGNRANAEIDLLGTPSEPMYEGAAQWGRDMAAAMRERGWQGMSDLTAAQVQAIGWVAINKMYGGRPQTALDSIQANARQLSFELAPGQGSAYEKRFGKAYGALPLQGRIDVTKDVNDWLLKKLSTRSGTHTLDTIQAAGAWGPYTEASTQARVVASAETAIDIANMLGYVSQQTGVFVSRPAPSGKSRALDIVAPSFVDPHATQQFWEHVKRAIPEIAEGFSPVMRDGKQGIRVFLPAGRALSQAMLQDDIVPRLHALAMDTGQAVDLYPLNVESTYHGNDWEKDPTGGSYLAPLAERHGPGLQRWLDDTVRPEFEQRFADAIEVAKERYGKAPAAEATPTPVPLGRVEPGEAGQKRVYSLFGELTNKNTLPDLKIYDLKPLVDDPSKVQAMLDAYGMKVKEFNFNTASPNWHPPNLRKDNYGTGTIWIYDPSEGAGSFHDEAYARAWRIPHELGHAATEAFVQKKYGGSHREGRLGRESALDRSSPKKTRHEIGRPLTLQEAQRSVEWEDLAFRAQRMLLADQGVKISDEAFSREYNTNLADALYRTLTGQFGDPGLRGFAPGDKRLPLKATLQALEMAEETIAKDQGRAATKGVDLKKWKPVSDQEIRASLDGMKKKE